jgi:glycosyltransferase involved in cell wall biosynthesis
MEDVARGLSSLETVEPSNRIMSHISVVVPVFNRREIASLCITALSAAAARDGRATVVVVDQGSSDGIRDAAASLPLVRVLDSKADTPAAMRNEGALASADGIVLFIDSDVLVPDDYFAKVRVALESAPNHIVGCSYALPDKPHWVERHWHRLNIVEGDGLRSYLDAGNMALFRSTFLAIGGFDGALVSGEDTDIARRARSLGIRCIQFQELSAKHLGNPKSLWQFFRKQRWHGRGGRATDIVGVTSIANAACIGFSLSEVMRGMYDGAPWSIRLLAVVVALIVVPAIGYLYRWRQTRTPAALLPSLVLLQMFLLARFASLFLERRVGEAQLINADGG